MRILYINPFWDPYKGGIETVISNLTENIAKTSSDVRCGLMTTYNLYPEGKVINKGFKEYTNNLIVYRINTYPNNIPYITNIRNSGYFSLEINNVIKDFQPDVIHFMTDGWYLTNLLVLLLSKRTRKNIKYVFSPFYHDIPKSISNTPMILCNKLLSESVDSIQVFSLREKEQIADIYSAPHHKIQLFKLGVNLPERKPLKTKTKKEPTILSVGRLSYAKGQFDLVKAFEKIRLIDRIPSKLILAGGDGGQMSEIKSYIDKHLIPDILITGFISDKELEKLYIESDIFVHPTRYESFGLSLFEALAHGLPVVTYNVGAITELITEGGILVPPFNLELLYKNIKELILNPKTRISLGKTGYEFVRNSYTWPIASKELIETYFKLL